MTLTSTPRSNWAGEPFAPGDKLSAAGLASGGGVIQTPLILFHS